MRAGSLTKRVTILRAESSVNDYNEAVMTWGEFCSVWAREEPISDSERFRAGETLANRKSRFTIRHSADVSSVDPRDRLRFDGRDWDIEGVKSAGAHGESIEITATARAETP